MQAATVQFYARGPSDPSTVYIAHNAARTRINRIAAEVDPDGHRLNVESLLRDSVAYTRGPKGYPGQIIRTTDLVPFKTVRQSRMYHEYWQPRDLHDGLRLTIAVDDAGNQHAINILRCRSGDKFGDADIALASALMPHLQRAIAMSQRLQRIDMLSSAALAALDLLHHAVLLLDQDGHLLHANTAGSSLLHGANGLGAQGRVT